MSGPKLSSAALDLLAAVGRDEIVRMPGGRVWNVRLGCFVSGFALLRDAGLVEILPVEAPSMDRSVILTDAGYELLSPPPT